eukprot:TRINITY_DN3039_c0_g1_i3.p1 TRINITY_DN3039_c0_g1~~TRINITY_DN3039_c0_g1_i3.p1  ORF type:complete len:915 (+),score=226.01 TRINITY_DN3039_c0_g1_i3:38-2746(+)
MEVDEQIDDELYNRQRYVLGDAAMSKMSKSDVLVAGVSGLGVEIAKNIALAGVRSITLQDTVAASNMDLSTNFFLSEADVSAGRNRAEACAPRLAELNPYVKIKTETAKPFAELPLAYFDQFAVVVLVGQPLEVQQRVDAHCRENKVGFLACSVHGLMAYAFADLGDSFIVYDTDGEECKELLIGGVTQASGAIVKALPYERHFFEAGDMVRFKEVGGMQDLNSGVYEVTAVPNPNSFAINADTSKMPAHTNGGIVVQVKKQVTMSFDPLSESLKKPKLLMYDTAKPDAPAALHCALLACDRLAATRGGRGPAPWDREDADAAVALARQFNAELKLFTETPELLSLVRTVAQTWAGAFQPLAAFLGGVVAQEALKAVTGKFSPLQQWLYADFAEVAPLERDSPQCRPDGSRYDAQRVCVGGATLDKLLQAKCFMVGAGAIGCEMLKNLVLMGVSAGANGHITVTDPDLIEKSNLNRQFLFRPSDLQKPKSTTAAKAALAMNPAAKITAVLDKMEPASETKYPDAFYGSLDAVVNALDNVNARMYMDARCLANERPLLESGTLGTKGHVQCIVPHITESYASQRDPDTHDVPLCTIHSFPNNMDHCIQWARDRFEKAFATTVKDIIVAFEDPNFVAKTAQSGIAQHVMVHRMLKQLNNQPKTVDDCIKLARLKFQSFFYNSARHLLTAFPLDMKTKEGELFWASPKRAPTPIVFDPSNATHLQCVRSTAHIFATVYGIKVDKQLLSDAHLTKVVSAVAVAEFKPKAGKRIITEKDGKEQKEKEEIVHSTLPTDQEWDAMLTQLTVLLDANRSLKLNPQQFEKDDDSNGHVDFVWSVANTRAQVYGIAPGDRVTAKRIAGNIIPAIATTTAAVSGLVMGELVQVKWNEFIFPSSTHFGLSHQRR